MRATRGVAVLACAGLLGCPGAQVFACRDDGDCDRLPGGVCLDDDACAYPVDTSVCASGLQRSSTAEDPGACVQRPTGEDGTASDTGATSTAAGTSSGDGTESSSGSDEPVVDEILASVAECLEDGATDPAACEETGGFGRLVVDGNPPPARTAYLRFDLAQTIMPASVQDVRLRLTVPDCEPCQGELSGDVFAVEAFELEDLSVAAPAMSEYLAEGVGPVVRDETIEIVLPAERLFPADRVHLALVATTANEVYFFNTRGLSPPVLVVAREP